MFVSISSRAHNRLSFDIPHTIFIDPYTLSAQPLPIYFAPFRRCDDNRGQFFFKNGAVVHYKFSDHQKKNLYDATKDHGKDQLSSYDAVFMNPGNDTPMTPEDAIGSATKVQAAGTPFFWLSTFIGVGSMTDWSDDQRSRFFASGARYLDIESMAQGMIAWNRGAIEGVTDSHFCLPGPPNEMALLVLKIIWAVNEENMDP